MAQRKPLLSELFNQQSEPVYSEFDLTQLKSEFDPAIVALFEHENVGAEAPFNMLKTACGQYVDLFQAYLYAKEEVLPFIRDKAKGISAITPKILLGWLNEAHKRIAQSLAGPSAMVAGEYSKVQLTRWQWGMLTADIVYDFVAGGDTKKEEIYDIGKQNGVALETINPIMRILEKMRSEDTVVAVAGRKIKINQAYLAKVSQQEKNVIGGVKFLMLLKELSPKDREILSDLVIVCMDPAEYPSAMQNFAGTFIKSWQGCDPQQNDQLADLLLQAYRGIAGIHPYGNGNGRLATWLMNVIMRSFDKPSFLMREPGEKHQEQSSYSQAIQAIDKNPELFKKHVLSRMQQAEKNGFIQCETECKVATIRAKLHNLLNGFQKLCPLDQLNATTESILIRLEQGVMEKHQQQGGKQQEHKQEEIVNDSTIQLDYNTQLLAVFEIIYRDHCLALSRATLSANPATLLHAQASSGKARQEEIKANVIKKLQALTGVAEGWKAYKQGTVVLLTVNDDRQAEEVAKKLSGMDIQAELNRLTDTKQMVVKVSIADVDAFIRPQTKNTLGK